LTEPDPTTDPTMDAAPPSGEKDAPTDAFSEPNELIGEIVAGRYKLRQKIGEGGMGAVYMAQQLEPVRRDVAIKIILPGMDSQQVLARFDQERQALAMLDHPNIARVLDAGRTERGQPYFAMELIKGVTITQFCNERRSSVRERVDLLVQVCNAIQHAHQKGIIHRDVKPSNVLVALYDDKPVPKVIDFGVAKATTQSLTAMTMFTQYGALVGTLEYMSPEQAQFNQLDIDTRSDVYSLGVLLYELLTGFTPFEKKRLRAAAFDEVLRIIREEEPPTPSRRLSTTQELASIAAQRSLEPKRLGAVIRGDLDWIVMKCLEKERSRRYDTANALAADLQRFLQDQPVSAGPPSAVYKVRKFLRRHRGPVAATAILLIAIVAGAGIAVSQAFRAKEAESLARRNEIAAKEEREAAQKAAEGERQAREAVERLAIKAAVDVELKQMVDDPASGLLRLAQTLESIPPHLGEFREIVAANILAWGQEVCPLPPLTHDGFDPVDARLNKAGTTVLTRGRDKTARLWSAIDGSPRAVLRHQGPVEYASFTADGKSAVTYDDADHVVHLWDAETGAVRYHSTGHAFGIRAIAHSATGDRIATLTDLEGMGGDLASNHLAGAIQVFDVKTGRRLGQAFHDPSLGAVFHMDPAGRFLVAVAGERALRVFTLTDRLTTAEHPKPRGTTVASFLSPNASRLALIDASGPRKTLSVWETGRWKLVGQADLAGAPTAGGWVDDATLALKEPDSGVAATYLFDGTLKEVRRFFAVRRSGELILGENGEVYDVKGGLLTPPRGRRYHPSLIEFAFKERWGGVGPLIDVRTEMSLGCPTTDLTATPTLGAETVYVGLDVQSRKRGLCRETSAAVPQTFLSVLPLPPTPCDADLLALYCRVAACGTLAASEKVRADDRAEWDVQRARLRQKLETLGDRLPPIARRIVDAACQSDTHWIRRRLAAADDSTAADELWTELLRREPTWKNHLERAFYRASSDRRFGSERLEHLMAAWRAGGSQYGDVVFDPLMDALAELSASADSKAASGADAVLRRLLGEIKVGPRRLRLVGVAALNAARAKKLDEAQRFAHEFERSVLQDGLKVLADAARRLERGGRGWDEYLATKQRACISRCLYCMVACLKNDRAAAEAAFREADLLRNQLLDQARPDELDVQDFFDAADKMLREAKG
jgi:hypothetical protein